MARICLHVLKSERSPAGEIVELSRVPSLGERIFCNDDTRCIVTDVMHYGFKYTDAKTGLELDADVRAEEPATKDEGD
jgi:hypothetical protein